MSEQGDGMDDMRHWLVDVPSGAWVHSPIGIVTDAASAERERAKGRSVSGPFVPAETLRGAVDASLREIVVEARDGDEWVSGHDLVVRVGAIVLDRVGGR